MTLPKGNFSVKEEETEQKQQMNSKLQSFLTWPIVSLIRRNVMLLVFLSGAVFLALNEWAFAKVGGLVYFPALLLVVGLGYKIARHFTSRKSTDAYMDDLVSEIKADGGKVTQLVHNYLEDFHNLDATHRVWVVTIEKVAWIIGGAILLAHVWK
jgi:hypothetical protein